MANSSIYNRFFEKNLKVKTGGSKDSVMNLLIAKKWFLVLVFANLIFQLSLTYTVMENTEDAEKKYNYWVLFGLSIIIIIVLALLPGLHPGIKIVLFSGFSYIMGLIFSTLKKVYTEGEIKLAIESVLGVFIAMFLSALSLLVVGVKFGYKFGLFLFFALLVLIIARIFTTPTKTTNKYFAVIGIIIFSLYIIYDTQSILQRDYIGDFITASIDYYLDIINLFLNLLSIENE